ncbi:MAG TPA: UvrD-helicase domain-containing protein, partial [Candidatus Sulfopaludibacter sp.]|nr:UvrD-helicase domain-containing protein [Candidatus Sulfopaludibacter sp.]
MSSATRPAPPDQSQREKALDASRSILVQAPAGSGKTDLLTRRFLRLLGEVEEPGQIVAITFTRAAAAEMRNRILAELEKAADVPGPKTGGSGHAAEEDDFSMESLARRALLRSRTLGWDLVRMPAQLRISTIDSFCRELALQQPLLSGLGGGLDITENAADLYRRAARRTLEQIGDPDSDLRAPELSPAIEKLLLWRDNGWQDMEKLLVNMLERRDQWMQEFLVARNPDWDALRENLERPFAREVEEKLRELDQYLDEETRDEAMNLARYACGEKNRWKQCKLFQITGMPCQPFSGAQELDSARQGYICLADLLLTKTGTLRKTIAMESPDEKQRTRDLIKQLKNIPGFEQKLHSIRALPPARYPEEEWQIVRACFTLLRHAAGELQVVFAEAGVVDFVEVSQVALRVLRAEDGFPTDAALRVADGIHHLLVDEFQDTSRRQHKLIGALAGAWPDHAGRSVFVVGDPMQSIYFFRDADAELFARVRTLGLELPDRSALPLDFVGLESNFRTAPPLVRELNDTFTQVFAENDGSGIGFSEARPAREEQGEPGPRKRLHLEFMPQTVRTRSADADEMRRKQEAADRRAAAHKAQTEEIVDLIRTLMERCEEARTRGEKFRIAVLSRARKALEPIAAALREAAIPFRAVDLESLRDRQEVLDALALARALFYREDRAAGLGVLRAPWCGLSLTDLHTLTSGDDADLLRRPVSDLLAERSRMLSSEGRAAVARVMSAMTEARSMRAAEPGASLGTWLEQVWLRLGGAACVDATGRANLDLLWKCLDQIEEGEPDLLGRGLDAALEKLMAQPDPGASSDYGVQLMSIHKSKGLEFEVVIVPDLQAGSGRGQWGLLSWLERGLEPGDESDEITEFLVAPLQSKGAERGLCKAWVDRVRAAREAQESRRILYVAATRAREELHLFARPEYKTENDGSYALCEPRDSLLATGWAALSNEVHRRFDEWARAPEDSEVESIAASGADNVLMMPRPAKPARVRRLPADFRAPEIVVARGGAESEVASLEGAQLYERHAGGALSRGLGNAVHALLEELALLRAEQTMDVARQALAKFLPRVIAQLRSAGMDPEQAAKIAARAMEIAIKASHDADGQWILSPHNAAASEIRWAGVIGGRLHEVRVDRVFRAGKTARTEGEEC